MLYSITKSPHYAYRELAYMEVIQGRADPSMNVSGELLLFITNRILARLDDAAAVSAETEAAVRREELAAEINAILEEQNVVDTVADSEEGHLEISLGRAQAVADYLVLLGAREKPEITAVGYGADYPIADNSTEEGRARNRRVEITILEN